MNWHIFLERFSLVWALVLNKNAIALADSDGAAALVLVSGGKALELGLQVIAKVTGYADAAQVHKIYFKYELDL